MPRQAGVLLPLFSLRSGTDWGVGEIPDLVPFARWAAGAGFSIVQVLPVNEASRGQNSPYAALTAFAIDPVYLGLDDVEDFRAAGGQDALEPEERARLDEIRTAGAVRWNDVRALKRRALDLAFVSFLDKEWKTGSERARALEAFIREQASWLEDYALFVALHDDEHGGRPWTEWPEPLQRREPAAVAAARERHADRILYHAWCQWHLDRQWHAAREEANALGVSLAGDMPFMVAADSHDVWARQDLFRLDARVGVPPDAFSATGQDWGLPVYRWDVMTARKFPWMSLRASWMARLYDLYRVDHVVGFYRTYYFPNDGSPAAFIPAEQPAQLRNGETVLRLLSQGARIIAEDLGTVPDFVRQSLTGLGIPGYRVMRWEKNWEAGGDRFRDPGEWPELSVATTGTHDTESLADWFDALTVEERGQLLAVPGLGSLRARAPDRFHPGVRDALLDLVYGARSELVLLPFADLFGTRERVNVPGTVTEENWTYRLPMDLATLAADRAERDRLQALAARSRRIAG